MHDLSLFILDIAQNSIAAEAKNIQVYIHEDHQENLWTIRIEDDGKGMTPEILKTVTSPFHTSRTTRKAGFGLAFLKAAAEQTTGSLMIDSTQLKGTTVSVLFHSNHIDCPPWGNLAETILALCLGFDTYDLFYEHQKGKYKFTFSTAMIKEALPSVSLQDLDIMTWIKDTLYEYMKELHQDDKEEGT